MQRKRLSIDAPADDGATQAYEISPQRLVHRDSRWQLDAWCHDHGSPMRWCIDAIVGARALDAPALDMGGGDGDTMPGDLTPLNSHADPDLQ